MRRLFTCLLLLLGHAFAAEDQIVPGTGVPVRLRGVSKDMVSSVEKVISDQLNLAEDKEASSALADDLTFFVRRGYLAQGFYQIDVKWSLEGDAVILAVDEGVQEHVGKITFTGNPGLSEKELERYLVRPTRERIGRLAVHTPYVEKEIADGLDLALRYVLSQGYADATIEPPVPTRHEDGSVDLLVEIKPGTQWKIGNVTIDGAPARLEDEMKFNAKGLAHQPVNEARIENMRRQQEGTLQASGWFAGKVSSASTRSADQTMDVVFTVVPGPLYRVEEIQIAPEFSHGGTRLVKSAFRPGVGHTYDSKRMELAYGRVIDTGLFEHLEMEPKPTGDGTLALVIKGEEAKRRSVGLSGGFDTFLGPILGLEYKNVNWWDSGGIFKAKIVGTQLGLLAGVQWKNPALFNSAYALAVDLKPETFTFEGYTRHTLALRTALSRDFNRHLAAEMYLGASVNEVSSDTLTILELGPDSYGLANAGLSLTYEARDNPVSPTRGWYASALVEGGYVTGGLLDVNYTRTDFAVSVYQPLTTKWRTALGAHFASLISGEDVGYIPIELRNYNGGAKGVRSFAERELGPRAGKDKTPLGGTQSQVVSGEVSYELIKNLEVAGFVDVGSLTTEKGSVLPNFDDIRYAAGVGLRYRLPFGPLRVDYGVNLDRRKGEAMGALHVGFGFAF